MMMMTTFDTYGTMIDKISCGIIVSAPTAIMCFAKEANSHVLVQSVKWYLTSSAEYFCFLLG